jgi:fructosamine-3-kinase
MDVASRELVERVVGDRVVAWESLGGGCVARVWRVTLTRAGSVVVKLGPGMDVEARSLAYLAEVGGVPTPRVMWSSSSVMIMAFVASAGGAGPEGEREAGAMLARLHGVVDPNMPASRPYGLGFDGLIGGLHQPNGEMEDWPTFFGERRLVAMARQAAEVPGRIEASMVGRVERLAAKLGEVLPRRPFASLMHGDLWSGNLLWREGRLCAMIDPAPYRGDAEVELAFITLFGTFGREFFDAYQVARPLDRGFWEERRLVYTLYPLLVHIRLFGGSYVAQAERSLRALGV